MGKLKFILPLLMGFAATAMAQANDVPPNAQPGKCYAKCHFVDVFETTTEQVLIKSATTKTVAVPATYETRPQYQLVKGESRRFVKVNPVFETVMELVDLKSAKEKLANSTDETATQYVLVKEESKRFIETPAVYESVSETYVIEPASVRIETFQPAFETVTERVETKPASTKWVRKKADASCLSANPDDCLVWCLVETPVEYQTFTKRINVGCDGSGVADAGCVKEMEVPAVMGTRTVQRIKKPATIREEIIPAEYKQVTLRRADMNSSSISVTKQVLKAKPGYREEIIPAEYKAVNAKVVKTPATFRTETIPPEYVTVTKRKLVKAGGFTEWREVMCGEEITGYTIRQIQDGLRKAGYYNGTSDNVMGAKTKAALTKFQKDKGLPVGNVDFETLKALGVKY